MVGEFETKILREILLFQIQLEFLGLSIFFADVLKGAWHFSHFQS